MTDRGPIEVDFSDSSAQRRAIRPLVAIVLLLVGLGLVLGTAFAVDLQLGLAVLGAILIVVGLYLAYEEVE